MSGIFAPLFLVTNRPSALEGGRLEEFRPCLRSYEPKRCIKISNRITPTLPSPLRGGGVGWGGQRAPGVRSRDHRKNHFSIMPGRAQAIIHEILMHLLSEERIIPYCIFPIPVVRCFQVSRLQAVAVFPAEPHGL
jgi:hypothetical protein